jgi:eukaryotic-like serine/threonine-protein kinase
MVHRGVKPSNIMVMPSGVAKIGDFGTGQIGDAALRYMSPEQVRGDPVDHRSDLFSLGAVFHEMLTRRAPFEGSSPEQIRQSIVQAQPPLPSQVNPHVPGALDAIVSRMLAGRADDRFSNARLLLRDLQRVEEELGLGPGASAVTRPRAQAAPVEPPPAIKREPALEPSAAADFQHRTRVPAVEAFPEGDARFIKDPEPRPEHSSGSRAAFLAALALMLAVLSIGMTVLLYSSPDLVERLTLAAGMREAPTPPAATALPPASEAIKEPATAPEASPPPVASDAKPDESASIASAPSPVPPQPLLEEPGPSAQTESSTPAEPGQAVTGDTAPTQEAPRVRKPRAKVAEPQPGAMAKLILAVSPKGELYIDGEHYGTTPPITTLELAPGMHQIEVRSGSRKPYVTYMTVQPGEERRIRHDFHAKPSRPPR